MKARSAIRLFAAAFGALAVTASHATISWTWQTTGTGLQGSGTFTTDDRNKGHYLITAMTGTVEGSAVTGLLAAGTIGGNDNLLWANAPQVDGNGFAFALGGQQYNVYYDTGSSLLRACSSAWDGCGTLNSADRVISFSAAAVPEPATYGLMGLGLAVVALARSRRRAAHAG